MRVEHLPALIILIYILEKKVFVFDGYFKLGKCSICSAGLETGL